MKLNLATLLLLAICLTGMSYADESPMPRETKEKVQSKPSQEQIRRWVDALGGEHEHLEHLQLFHAGDAAVPEVVRALESNDLTKKAYAEDIVRSWVEFGNDEEALQKLEQLVPERVQSIQRSATYWFRRRGYLVQVVGDGLWLCTCDRTDYRANTADEIHIALRRLKDMEGVESVYIDGAGLFNEAHLAELSGIKTLRGLSIPGRHTEVTDSGLAHLEDLQSLEALSIGHGKFTDDGLAALAKLTSLKRLELPYTPISARGLRHLRDLDDLETIKLQMQDFPDEAVDCLTEFESLKSVELHLTAPIDDDTVDRLKKITSLTNLRISAELLSEESIATLKQLPNCAISDWSKKVPAEPGSNYPSLVPSLREAR